MLKQITPGVTRAAILRDPTQTAGIGVFGAIQALAKAADLPVQQPTDYYVRRGEAILAEVDADRADGGE
jgi:hypothetical protein